MERFASPAQTWDVRLLGHLDKGSLPSPLAKQRGAFSRVMASCPDSMGVASWHRFGPQLQAVERAVPTTSCGATLLNSDLTNARVSIGSVVFFSLWPSALVSCALNL